MNSKKILKWIGISIGGFIVLMIVLVIVIPEQPSEEPTTQPETEQETPASAKEVEEKPTPSAEEEIWKEVKSWSECGEKITEAFAITSKKWRIEWRSSSWLLGTVQREGKTLAIDEGTINSPKAGQGTTYVNQSGRFYLDISSGDCWTVTVEELK